MTDPNEALATRLRVARAWQDWTHQQAAADFGVSRQTFVAYESGAIPVDKVADLEAWARRHTPQTDADRAHAFGMLEAVGRMGTLIQQLSDDARRRLGDPQLVPGIYAAAGAGTAAMRVAEERAQPTRPRRRSRE